MNPLDFLIEKASHSTGAFKYPPRRVQRRRKVMEFLYQCSLWGVALVSILAVFLAS